MFVDPPKRGLHQPWADFKAERRAFWAAAFGLRRTYCLACYGSGRYDNAGSPPCGACDGQGFTWVPGPKHAAFQGQHARRTPRSRCTSCGDRTDDLYGCPARR